MVELVGVGFGMVGVVFEVVGVGLVGVFLGMCFLISVIIGLF